MNNDKKNKIQVIVLVIILILVIIFAVNILNKNKSNKQDDKQAQTGSSAINPDDPAYANMKIYQKDGDTIIEGEDGSKTIETTKTKENTGLTETTKEEKEKYQITDVKVRTRGSGTSITGKVKNNDTKNHTVVINIKFYSEDNKIKGAATTKLTIEKGQAKDFALSTMDDMTKYKYNIVVDYAD